MGKGKLTISIDFELAWGWWDILTSDILHLSATAERPICTALLELFDRHQIPATWATVAAVLDEPSSRSRPGGKDAWYAPDIMERILGAKVRHEIGSHSGRHIYFDVVSQAEAGDDLAFAKDVHRANRLPFDSFVFPRNHVGHLDVLARAGLKTFRGPDGGWSRLAAHAGPMLSRLVTAADKFLPIPPQPARAAACGALVDVPGSMQLPGRNGARRFVLPQVMRAKLAMGLDRARRTGDTFHFWFHPCNFYYRREEQLAIFAWFLERVADEASRGRIEIRTMGSYAGRVDRASAPGVSAA